MQTKDYITLALSLIAISVSFYNLYIQQFRRREHLTGAMFSTGINDSVFDRKMEYVLSNTGDVQLAVKQVELLIDGRILNSEATGIPVILKPGDVALVDIFYKEAETEDESITEVEFGVFSAKGNGYRLPHNHREDTKDPNSIWDSFELKKLHKGF